MKTNKTLVLLASLLFLHSASRADEAIDMRPYPAAADGFVRMVFRVPSAEDESARKVEIVVGKILSVDCNRTSFNGVLDRRVAKGWGYPYYVLEKVGGPVSTLMACPPGTQNTDGFVSVKGDGFLQRYNSKLPMVVYVPEGYDVRYRVWAAQQAIGQARAE
jgi:ecotin